MSQRVPADQIEDIVGAARHDVAHYARASSAEQTVYVLHSRECLAIYDDLRSCPFARALDNGITQAAWAGHEDVPVLVEINRRTRPHRLVPVLDDGPATGIECTRCCRAIPGQTVSINTGLCEWCTTHDENGKPL